MKNQREVASDHSPEGASAKEPAAKKEAKKVRKGRPATTGRGDVLGKQLLLRVSLEERALLDAVAEKEAMTTASWVRSVALSAAEERDLRPQKGGKKSKKEA